MSWLQFHTQGSLLQLKVSPGARHTSLVGLYGEWLKVRVHSEPVKGQANEELISWLAQILQLRRDQVQLLKGQSSGLKKFLLLDISPTDTRQRFQAQGLQLEGADV